MSLTLKLCFMVSVIYLCQFVQSYGSRHKSICTQLVYTGTGYKNVKSCCNGFTKDTRSSGFLICKPVCRTGCPNGRCVAPEVCFCDIGYTISPATFICEPKCFELCFNGDCVAPDTCKCRPGFRELNVTYCEPILPLCSPSCFNGDCVGPSKCQCHDGYELSGWDEARTSCLNAAPPKFQRQWDEPLFRDGFDFTCLPRTTTSTTTHTALISSTDDDEVLAGLSETTYEASSSDLPPEVTNQDKVVTDQYQVVTDQGALHLSAYDETSTEPNFTTEDVNEVTASETNFTDGSMTVIVLFGGFTELDDDSANDEYTKNGTKMWIYISAAILIVAVVLLLLVAFRRRLLGYIKRRTYVVQGEQTRRASVSSRTFNVTFSSTSNGK